MTFRELEAASIRGYVESVKDFLIGDVLDFGCGLQPYRDIVEGAGGVYHPFDRRQFPANISREDVGWDADHPRLKRYDAILCTQIIQYVPDPAALLRDFNGLLLDRGFLVLTGPTNWPLVERWDLTRYTLTGIRDLLTETGFRSRQLIDRAQIEVEGEQWSLGWACLAEPLERE